MADTPCKQQDVLFGVACSPTFASMPASSQCITSEPAYIPSAVAARKRRQSFLLLIPGKAKFVSYTRATATSLVLTLLWVQQALAQMVSREAPANGPKTLLEAVNGTDAGQANESGNDDERLDPDRPKLLSR